MKANGDCKKLYYDLTALSGDKLTTWVSAIRAEECYQSSAFSSTVKLYLIHLCSALDE